LGRGVARAAIAGGLDKKLAPEQRIFHYLPFEHGEASADQVRALALISNLADEA
jgi:uncharacterized protein (DUF924 family)